MEIDLAKVIGYSRDSLQSRALMRAIMLDLYPGKTREMNVLLDVYESGVPREIKKIGTITDAQYAAYIQKIVLDYGLQENLVIEGLDAWIDVCLKPGTAAQLRKPKNIDQEESTSEQHVAIQHTPIVTKSVSNVSGSDIDFETKSVGPNQVEIIKFKGFDEKELIVPSTIKGNSVVGVGENAYKACKTVEKITIAEGIQYINDGAFAECSALTKVILPSTLKYLGTKPAQNTGNNRLSFYSVSNGVFSATKITDISLPTGLIYMGRDTFRECSELISIDIPNGIKEICDGTFKGCSMLMEVVMPDFLVTIGKSAFYGCAIETIVLPNSVREIKDSAFSYCRYLKDVRLNEGLQTIGAQVFLNTKEITQIVIPSTVTSIGNGMFDISRYPTNKKNTKVVFYCYAGSEAITYARKNGYPVQNAAKLNL